MDFSLIGTHRVEWADIKKDIKRVNPALFQLIENVDDSKDMPLYVTTFSWGQQVGDEYSQFLAKKDGSVLRLAEDSLPRDIQKELGYGSKSSPVGMILNNSFEWYVDIQGKQLTLPYKIYKPGMFFAFAKVLDGSQGFNYSPMGVLKGVCGARTCFMLPNISYKIKFNSLFKKIGIKKKPPKSLYDHFSLFHTIYSSYKESEKWTASILYFSEGWANKIKSNTKWSEVKNYFFKLKANLSSYSHQKQFYNIAYSLSLESANQKPNPYLFDTFKHLVDIASGEIPGFSPQVDNNLVPIDTLQKIFIELYGINYIPTIIAPKHISLKQKSSEKCYYSMNFPTTFSFSPSSARLSNAGALSELIDIYDDICATLKHDDSFCSGTIIQHIFKEVEFKFLHSSLVDENRIEDASLITSSNPDFLYSSSKDLMPCLDSPFFKGCIELST